MVLHRRNIFSGTHHVTDANQKFSSKRPTGVGTRKIFCTVARISLDKIIRHLIPFVCVILACLLIITYVPALSLGLRDLVYR